jgi:hypothetical protein
MPKLTFASHGATQVPQHLRPGSQKRVHATNRALVSGVLGVVSVILFRDLVVWLEVSEVETHMVVRLSFSIY